MYYSILPITQPDPQTLQYVEMEYNGIQVLACQTEEGYVLERIYSSDPKDFINLMPGDYLEEHLINKKIQ